METGRLIWVCGLAGAGKTSIGSLLYKRLKVKKANLVFLDGDEMRQIFDNHDYSADGRRRYSDKSFELIKTLTSQNIDVICCVLGMRDYFCERNRANIENYFEIYIRVSMDVLIKRDQKKLYSRALKGEIRDVVGIDIKAEEPKNPDMIIDNDGGESIEVIVDRIIDIL